MLSAGRVHKRILGCPAEEGPTGYSDLPLRSVLSRHSVIATWTFPYTEKRCFVRKVCENTEVDQKSFDGRVSDAHK